MAFLKRFVCCRAVKVKYPDEEDNQQSSEWKAAEEVRRPGPPTRIPVGRTSDTGSSQKSNSGVSDKSAGTDIAKRIPSIGSEDRSIASPSKHKHSKSHSSVSSFGKGLVGMLADAVVADFIESDIPDDGLKPQRQKSEQTSVPFANISCNTSPPGSRNSFCLHQDQQRSSSSSSRTVPANYKRRMDKEEDLHTDDSEIIDSAWSNRDASFDEKRAFFESRTTRDFVLHEGQTRDNSVHGRIESKDHLTEQQTSSRQEENRTVEATFSEHENNGRYIERRISEGLRGRKMKQSCMVDDAKEGLVDDRPSGINRTPLKTLRTSPTRDSSDEGVRASSSRVRVSMERLQSAEQYDEKASSVKYHNSRDVDRAVGEEVLGGSVKSTGNCVVRKVFHASSIADGETESSDGSVLSLEVSSVGGHTPDPDDHSRQILGRLRTARPTNTNPKQLTTSKESAFISFERPLVMTENGTRTTTRESHHSSESYRGSSSNRKTTTTKVNLSTQNPRHSTSSSKVEKHLADPLRRNKF